MRNNYSNTELTYAGFWVRLAAYCIDSAVVFLALLAVRLFLSGIMALLEGTVLGGNILFHYTLKDILLYIFQVLYFILCTWLTGTTLGKKAMNLRVVSAQEGGSLRLLDIVYRETVGRFLCGLSVGIGYMVAGWDGQKRGFHDMLCDTRVIYAKRIKVYPVYQAPAQGMNPMPGNGPVPPQGMNPMPGNGPVPPQGMNPMPGNGPVPPQGMNPMPGNPPAPEAAPARENEEKGRGETSES
ncbi:RDD family protein [Lachnospiraceae bacterium KGMB03038]|nr:RDD family protein [Lachnospiraceae bacterium KGMB03038]